MKAESSSIDKLKGYLDQLFNLNAKELFKDPLLQFQITKIRLLASLPLCSENTIRILKELLTLKHEYKTEKINKNLKVDIAFVHSFVQLAKDLLDNEGVVELEKLFSPIFDECLSNKIEEKLFYGQLKQLCEKNISCVDIDFVMETAVAARRIRDTVNKSTVLVIGPTGSGKSFVMNYIGFPIMFRREKEKFFGPTVLKIHENEKPDYLKHIQIGHSVLSETYKVGVLNVDDINYKNISSEMNSFKKEGLVLCDTPGSEDNRNAGPELKLANSLQAVATVHRAKEVRFLALIPGSSTEVNRGEAFRKAIEFFSRMFADASAVTAAADSMVFAITADDGFNNSEKFKAQLQQFDDCKVSLGLDDKTQALIAALKAKFQANEVLFIRPGLKPNATPDVILSSLLKCKSIEPKILCPFAEAGIGKLLEDEATLLTQSMDRLFDAMKKDFSADWSENRAQRLTIQFAKLSFMDSYYTVNKTNVLPYFTKLVEMMNQLKQEVLTVFCPKESAISEKVTKNAFGQYRMLVELDKMVRVLINGFFSDNRQRVIDLIRAFNDKINPPQKPSVLEDAEWFSWLEQNRPLEFAKSIEQEVQKFQLTEVTRLKGLIDTLQIELNQQQAQYIDALSHFKQPSLNHVAMIELQPNHPASTGYSGPACTVLSGGNPSAQMSTLLPQLTEKLACNLKKYCHAGQNILSDIAKCSDEFKIFKSAF